MTPKLPMTSAVLKNRFERRTFVLGLGQASVGILLAARLGYLAVAENDKYRAASESNRVNLTLIPPRRGWVIDRTGVPLASNRADFRVDYPAAPGRNKRKVDPIAFRSRAVLIVFGHR